MSSWLALSKTNLSRLNSKIDSKPIISASPTFPLSLFTLPSLNAFWVKPILSLYQRLNKLKSNDKYSPKVPLNPISDVIPLSSFISGFIE